MLNTQSSMVNEWLNLQCSDALGLDNCLLIIAPREGEA